MNNIVDFLSGRRILEEADSKINGHLVVEKDMMWGTHIKGGGLTQSGGVAYQVWEEALKKSKDLNPEIKSSLILGLGGGSIATIITKFWPESQIIGVDLDEVIVDLGKRYLNMPTKTKVIFADAEKYLIKNKTKIDLICVDTYLGSDYPKHIESKEFVELINKRLTKSGIAVFNRLYYGEKRKQADKFCNVLEGTFSKVVPVYVQANVLFVAKA